MTVDNPQSSSDAEVRMKITLEDVLIFATGSSSIPVAGFNPPPSISFRHPADIHVEDSFTEEFAYANTCANSLSLPVLRDYEVFKARVLSSFSVKAFTMQ